MLSNRLTLAMVALVLVTAFAIGLLARGNLESTVVPVELERMRIHNELLARSLEAYVANARTDVLGLVGSAALAEVQRSPGSARARAALAREFAAQLAAKPPYLQLRLIDAATGRERVRVERPPTDAPPRAVPDDRLQDKGGREYVRAALAAPSGEVVVSPIELNREHGQVEIPHVPVLRTAIRIDGPEGRAFGVLVLNVDMRPAFRRLQAPLYPGGRVEIFDSAGMPLPGTKIDGDGARLAKLLLPSAPGRREARVVEVASGERLGLSATSIQLAGGPRAVVVEWAPYSGLTSYADALNRSSLLAGGLAVVLALAAAVLLARTLTRPLTQMTVAVAAVARGDTAKLPVRARGEIGVLARAIARMSDDVRTKTVALEAQIERERTFLAVVESASQAILAMDDDGAISAWNPAAERLFGYTAEETLGRSVEMLVPPERREEQSAILERVRAGRSVERLETVRVAKDGRPIAIALDVSPIVAESGEQIGVSAIAQDLTESRRVEENFRRVVESSPSGICAVDAGGRIRLVNPAVERLFGYDREELLGMSIEQLVPERLRAGHRDLREEFHSNPVARPMGEGRDLWARRKDGSEFAVEIGLSPLEGPTDRHVLCSIVDITERRRAMQQLSDYAERLKASNAELEQFAYVVSHDLRAPLRGIALVAEWFGQDYRDVLDDEGRENLELLLERTDRLDKLVNGILEYSRAGRAEPERVPVDIEPMVRDVAASIDPPEGVTVRVEGELPQVRYDETQLRQVLQNLIDNAVTNLGKPRGEVVVSAAREGDAWAIRVQDDGPGIPERHFERIFGLFQTLRPKDECRTAGAGLAIAKRIVERNGGEIRVASRVGEGATFTFTVPVDRPPRAASRTREVVAP